MIPVSLVDNEIDGIRSLDGFAGQGPEVGVPDGDLQAGRSRLSVRTEVKHSTI